MDSEAVCWAVYAMAASIEHMRVDHGRTDICVPEQFLNGSDVVAVLKQVARPSRASGRTDFNLFGRPRRVAPTEDRRAYRRTPLRRMKSPLALPSPSRGEDFDSSGWR